MDALEIKRNAFCARWLNATAVVDPACYSGAAAPSPLAPVSRRMPPAPRIVFREQAFADALTVRRPPVLTRLRLKRAALRLSIAMVALAATGAGLQQLFKTAPTYLTTIASYTKGGGTTSTAP